MLIVLVRPNAISAPAVKYVEWRSGYCAVTLSNYDLSILWGNLPFSLGEDMSKSTARFSIIVIGCLRQCGRLHEPECKQTAALRRVGSHCTWRREEKLTKARFYLHVWSVEPAICKQRGSHFGMNTDRQMWTHCKNKEEQFIFKCAVYAGGLFYLVYDRMIHLILQASSEERTHYKFRKHILGIFWSVIL
jgi:hypothetical protein